MTTPIYKYPLDLTGSAVANLVTNEPQTLVSRPVRAIAPMWGAFFANSVIVTDTANNTPLRGPAQSNPQYYFAELAVIPIEMTGQEVAQVIVITDTTVSNNVSLQYQVVGGPFSISAQAIVDVLDNLQDNTTVQWANIENKPAEFPPSAHFHSMDDTYGWEYVTDALNRVAQAIMLGDRVAYQQIYQYVDAQIANVNATIAQAAITTMNEINSAMSAHLAAANPHPQYLLAANANTYPLVRTPTNETPAAGNLNNPVSNVTFSGDAYHSLYGVNQGAAEFRMSTNPGCASPFVFDVVLGAVNSYTYPSTLSSSVSYYWQCRYQDAEGVWSAWSTPTAFTTVAIGIITPTITFPGANATGINPAPQLTASAFATSGTSDTQKSASWEIWTNSLGTGTLVWSSENDTVNLTSITVPGGQLSQSTNYAVRVRYTGNTLGNSNYSPWINFTTGIDGISTPTITYPAANAQNISLSPTLTASPFAAFGGTDTQRAASWEVWTTGSNTTLVWSSENDTVNLTSITVPQNTLQSNTAYQARVQYTGNAFGVSAWSAWDAFTVGNYSVNAPTIISPASNSTVATQAFSLVGNGFSVTGTTDTQKSASWEIWTDPASFTSTIPAGTTAGTSIAGGVFGGTITINNITYGIIVAPASSGETTVAANTMLLSADTTLSGSGTTNDSLTNCAQIQSYGSSPAINWVHGLTIGGFTDWTLPSVTALTTAMSALGETVFAVTTSGAAYLTSTYTGAGTDTVDTVSWSSGSTPVPVTAASAKVNASVGAVHAVRLVPMSSNVATLVWSSEADTANLTSIAVPTTALTNNITYQARVKYTGNTLGDSAWSPWSILNYAYSLYPSAIGQAYGGGFYMGDTTVNNKIYGIILAPKASGETTLSLLSTVASSDITNAKTYNDSATNTSAWISAAASMSSTTAPAAAWAKALSIGGYTDWQVPASKIMHQINAVANTASTALAAYKSGGAEAFSTSYWTSTFTRHIANYYSTFTAAVPQSGGNPIYSTQTVTKNESASQWYPNIDSSKTPAATCQTGTVGNVTHGYFVGTDPNTNQPGTLNSTTWTCTYQTQVVTGYTPVVPAQPAYYTPYYSNTQYMAKAIVMQSADTSGEETDCTAGLLVRAVRLVQRPIAPVAVGTFTFTIPGGLNVDLRTAALNAGWNGTQALVANVSANIGSNTTANAGLTITGAFPGGVTLNIAAGVYIAGAGGAGGANQVAGSPGGVGIAVSSVTGAVSINNLGTIAGGGGGGAGGYTINNNNYNGSGVGGGGAGSVAGLGGAGIAYHGISCYALQGTLTTGSIAVNSGSGVSGTTYATAGGNLGVAAANDATGGYNGGAAGYATTGSSGVVTWVAQGTTLGTVN